MIGLPTNRLDSSVLVLNRYYMAMRLIPLRQALLLLCRNTTRGNRTPKQANMELQQQPQKPALHPQMTLEENNVHYSLWKTFLVSP